MCSSQVSMNECVRFVFEGTTREPDTYRMKRELQILIDRGCYNDTPSLKDNYQLVDNSQ